MTPDFTGQVALVTGAGKGLGRAYALWLAARGCAVVVNNRLRAGEPSSAQAVVDEIRAAGGSAVAAECSIETEAGASIMVDLALATYGRLDILVCNAAVSPDLPFLETSIEQLRNVIDVNLLGSLLPLRLAFTKMLEAGYGRVVLTSSSTSLYGHTDSAVYASTKSSVIGLARALAREVPRDADIKINVVVPFAYTPASARQMDPSFAEFLAPDKVAPVVGWLVSRDCNESGMILHAGAGGVTRVRLLETAPVDVSTIGTAEWQQMLAGPVVADEARSANQAGGRISQRKSRQ